MSKLEWFLVFVTEYSGYDCDGHRVPRLVAAASESEALAQFDQGQFYDDRNTCFALHDLPDISTKRRPRVLDNWALDNHEERFYGV